MTKWIVSGAVVALAAGTAIAQMPMRMEIREMMQRGPETRAEVEARVKAHFAEVDANKDGTITRDETEAYKTAQRDKAFDSMFDSIDADHNGAVSREEFRAYHAGMAKGMAMGAAMAGDKGHQAMMMHGDMSPPPPSAMAMPGEPGAPHVMTRVVIRQDGDAMFGRADANRDGTLTPDERKGAMKTVIRKRIIERRDN